MLGLYLHLPFCPYACAYCDFAVLVGQDRLIPEYLDLLEAEIGRHARRYGKRLVATIHFGGGTPSHIPASGIARLLDTISSHFALSSSPEIALEANPDSVTSAKVRAWRDAGVNRVTIGWQALAQQGLDALGRPAAAEDGARALESLLEGGIESCGIDLIFGRPGQTLASWIEELEALPLDRIRHLSCYALELDSRTRLVRMIERGHRPSPDEDLCAAMYEVAVRRLADAGFARYEVSNFALPGYRSRHNLRYWQDEEYLGVGMSAASYLEGERWTNPRGYRAYARIARGEGAPVLREPFDRDRRAGEALVFGLRLETGVDLAQIERRYGKESLVRRESAIARAVDAGALIREGSRMRLPPGGFFTEQEVLADLL